MHELYTHEFEDGIESYPHPTSWWKNFGIAHDWEFVKTCNGLYNHRGSYGSYTIGLRGYLLKFESTEDAIMFVLRWS